MLKFLNLEPEIFGMDINDLFLRIVKMKKRGRAFIITSFNEVAISPGVVKEGVVQDREALVKLIKDGCRQVKGEKLGTKYVIAALPEEKSFSQVIQMPKMTLPELKSAVPFQAENYIPLPIDKVYLDFQVINPHRQNEDSSHLDLLINAIPKPIVDSYILCFNEAGLVPCIFEVESQAIVRALVKEEKEMPPTIFIDFGRTKTSFIIFSGGAIRFTSSIAISSNHLTRAIADRLALSFEEAEGLKIEYGLENKETAKGNIMRIMIPVIDDLMAQVKKYINFYYGHVFHDGYILSDRKIEKIILCGGGANLKKMPDFVSAELKIPVEIGNPLVNISLQPSGLGLIPVQKGLSFTAALGLALRGVSDPILSGLDENF